MIPTTIKKVWTPPPVRDSSYEMKVRRILEEMQREGLIDGFISQEPIKVPTYKWPFRPDFIISKNGKQLVLEVQSRLHIYTWRGKLSKSRPKKDANKRLHLTNAGYLYLEVWPKDLRDPEKVKHKILEVLK